jgi:hypothetical protein
MKVGKSQKHNKFGYKGQAHKLLRPKAAIPEGLPFNFFLEAALKKEEPKK